MYGHWGSRAVACKKAVEMNRRKDVGSKEKADGLRICEPEETGVGKMGKMLDAMENVGRLAVR